VSNRVTICETAFAYWGESASFVEGPSASVWRIGRGVAQLQASKPRSGEAAHGAVPSPQAPAWGPAPSEASESLPVYPERSRRAGSSGGKYAFTGNENRPLTAVSNRKSNDSRKRTTLSESATSNFLIATKLHISEEKAKSEERVKLLLTRDAHKPSLCASATARLASEHSRGALSGRCNVTPDFSMDFAGAGRNSMCPSAMSSN
jgi:hypothetical protein